MLSQIISDADSYSRCALCPIKTMRRVWSESFDFFSEINKQISNIYMALYFSVARKLPETSSLCLDITALNYKAKSFL
jgi:hypothetical protein